MRDSELQRLLEQVESAYEIRDGFSDELWSELSAEWVDGPSGEATQPANTETWLRKAPPSRNGRPVTWFLVAAISILLVGFATFALMNVDARDDVPVISAPDQSLGTTAACMAFVEKASELTHLLSSTSDPQGGGAPFFPAFDPPESRALTNRDLVTVADALDDLISSISDNPEITDATLDGLRVVQGLYSQASLQLARGDGGSAQISVETAKERLANMAEAGQLSALPSCFPIE